MPDPMQPRNVTELEARFTADAGEWVLTMRVHFAPDDVVEFTHSGTELAPLFTAAGQRVEREVAARC